MTLAIIPARGGSKRIPFKNGKLFCKAPLLAWSIKAALESQNITRVVVSTDNKDLAKLALDYGAEVPFIRPEHLANDKTPGVDPVLHAISSLKYKDDFILLQPTSPLRDCDDIDGIINFASANNLKSTVSVCSVNFKPSWLYNITNGGELSPLLPSQQAVCMDKNALYIPNGALYYSTVNHLLKYGSLISQETYSYIMENSSSIDIDTKSDWLIAEFLMQKKISEGYAYPMLL